MVVLNTYNISYNHINIYYIKYHIYCKVGIKSARAVGTIYPVFLVTCSDWEPAGTNEGKINPFTNDLDAEQPQGYS